MAVTVLRLHPTDDVGVAISPLHKGDALPGGAKAAEPIAAGHKVALRPIAAGSPVRKYGQVIGAAREPIAVGGWVHTHNFGLGDRALPAGRGQAGGAAMPTLAGRTFDGYLRPDGRGATRNYLAVITSVNCSAHAAKRIARRAEERLGDFPHIDGVVAITHGWAAAQMRAGRGWRCSGGRWPAMRDIPTLRAC